MKTPRELILERHQAAEARLEAIRAEDLAAEARGQRRPSLSFTMIAQRLWLEALWPWRRVWVGVGAAWLVILTLDLATADTPRVATARTSRPDAQVQAVLQQQEQLLTQLLGVETPPPPSHPTRPGPRSAAPPTPGTGPDAGRLETTLYAQTLALA
jgi:hypothetical protein